MKRLVILTEIISPYRIPLFNALARHGAVDLHVIFLAETDPGLRQWHVYKDEIKFSYEVLPSWRRRIGRFKALINTGLNRALTAASPDAIVCGGYSYLASWQTLLWAKKHNVPFLLWSESIAQELRRGYALVEFLKDEFLQRCCGFVVPGQLAREYLRTRRIKDELIFTACNAVDNDFFTAAAADARHNAMARRSELRAPDRYFLFAGRLVREKGVFELLSAYATLNEQIRLQTGLVFAGDGPCRQQLEERAAAISPGKVMFAGFAQREQLAAYYALAEMLVLPTYSDTWGLVVNEAMACGLPVILSQVAGCAPELVRQNWNGLLIPPRNVRSLAAAMQELASRPDRCASMGVNSAQLVLQYSPEKWSSGMVEMMEVMAPTHD